VTEHFVLGTGLQDTKDTEMKVYKITIAKTSEKYKGYKILLGTECKL